MYEYSRKNRMGLGSILLIILFVLSIIGLAVLFFINKGKFWDILPIASIVIIVLSLIFAIFNMARRAEGGFIFILFFIIFLAGLIISSIFGPFALSREAQKSLDSGDYRKAIDCYNEIIDKYSSSRYYDTSLAGIISAYKETNDYENIIKYINIGAEKNILDKDSLEIKNSLSEAYAKIAETAYTERNYEKSAVNFTLAINILKEITKDFPNSDAAFIASYKIPEYLLKASESYFNTGSYSQSISLLNEIIEQYPENEIIADAKSLLIKSYMNEIKDLIDDEKYKEAMDEYILVQEVALENNTDIAINIYDESVFSNIPDDILSEYAINMTLDKKYEIALHIFDYILNENPDSNEDINKYYAICKIETIKEMPLEQFPEIKYWSSTKDDVNFSLNINNNTDFILNIYFSGNIGSIFKLNPKTRADIVIQAGTYKIAAEYDDEQGIKYYGEFQFEAGKRYSQVFSIEAKKE